MATRTEIAKLYVATFNRAADADGLAYWVSDGTANTTILTDMEDIATGMLASPEASALYAGMSREDTVIEMYANLFNRTVDATDAGAAYWINGSTSLNDMIIALINGAQGEDITILDNKAEVGEYYADHGFNDVATAISVMETVTANNDTVYAAINTINATTTEPDTDTPTETVNDIELTIGHADLVGTDANDTFVADQAQNALGGVANTLSSASDLDGGAGTDTLNAEIIGQFGGSDNEDQLDIVPETVRIENVTFDQQDDDNVVVVDAKEMTDIVEIGSFFSDGDLVIENLTTLTETGNLSDARNTNTITVTMDHTDNFNSDNDASDLTVLFDEDYFITDSETSGSSLTIHMNNVLNIQENMNPIEGFTAVSFDVGGETVTTDISTATSYADAVTLINAQLNEQGLDTVTAELATDKAVYFSMDIYKDSNDTITYNAGDEAGSYSPILVTNSGSALLSEGGFELGEEAQDGDINHTQTDAAASTVENPLSVNVDLFKVGREGEGGDLVIGGKELNTDDYKAQIMSNVMCDADGNPIVDPSTNKGDGINEFHIDVLGNEDQMSNLGKITSTNGALEKVYIETATAYANSSSVASLTIRDGFYGTNEFDNALNALTLVDADDFLGDLNLGEDTSIYDVTTITAEGGGDVTLYADNTSKLNIIQTASGEDTINVVDAGGINIDTGSDDDAVNLLMGASAGTNTVDTGNGDDVVTILNATAINSVSVELGSGDDILNGNGLNVSVDAGSGDDISYLNNIATKGSNVTLNTTGLMDVENTDLRGSDSIDGRDDTADTQGATATDSYSDSGYNFLFGRTLTVTFNADQGTNNDEADSYEDGYESVVTIEAASYDHMTTKADLTAAIDKAINEDAVLSDLVTSSGGVVTSKIDGDNNSIQLSLGDTDWTDSIVSSIEADYQALYNDSDATISDSYSAHETLTTVAGADCDNTQSNTYIVNKGDDTVVLSTSIDSTDTIDVNTAFDTLTVVNFTTNQDRLDFETYLTDEYSFSGSEASSREIETAYDDDTVLEANEVTVLDFDNTDSVESFSALTASNLVATLDLTHEDYSNGTYNNNGEAVDLVDFDGSSIVMVHNQDNLEVENDNEGQYKVFSVSFDGNSDDSDEFTSIEYLGMMDFGSKLGTATNDDALTLASFVSTGTASTTETIVEDPVVDPDPEVPTYDNTLPVGDLTTEDATTGDNAYTITMGTGVQIANIDGMTTGDALDIDEATYGVSDYSIGTDGTTTVTFIFGDLTDYTPSWLINMNDLDAAVVTDVAAAADTAAAIGVLDAALGDWLV